MGESTGEDDRIEPGKRGVAVPHDLGVPSGEFEPVEGVELTVRTGELDDGDPSGHVASTVVSRVMVYSSITGLARSFRHISSTSASAAAASSPETSR